MYRRAAIWSLSIPSESSWRTSRWRGLSCPSGLSCLDCLTWRSQPAGNTACPATTCASAPTSSSPPALASTTPSSSPSRAARLSASVRASAMTTTCNPGTRVRMRSSAPSPPPSGSKPASSRARPLARRAARSAVPADRRPCRPRPGPGRREAGQGPRPAANSGGRRLGARLGLAAGPVAQAQVYSPTDRKMHGDLPFPWGEAHPPGSGLDPGERCIVRRTAAVPHRIGTAPCRRVVSGPTHRARPG